MVQQILLSIFVLSALLLSGCNEEPTSATEPNEYLLANGYNGGKLYDQFWAEETGFPFQDSVIIDQYPKFFRCVVCHGWDQLGRAGGFARYFPSNTNPNATAVNLLATAKSVDPAELFNLIKTGRVPAIRRSRESDLSTYDPVANNSIGDMMPDYSVILPDAQIWNLVKFLKTEVVDVSLLYDFALNGEYPQAARVYSNLGKDGNAVQGKAIYDNNCGSLACHGPDGSESAGMAGTIGKYLRGMPYQCAHIFKFGFLGSDMGEEHLTDQQLKDLFKALADSTLFP